MESPMTVRELSEYLKLDRMTIYKMLKERTVPASRIGHQWRFFRADIDEWIHSLRAGTKPEAMVIVSDTATGELIKTELSAANYEVSLAAHGDEAVTLVDEREFDVVFIELRRATMDTFRRIREVDGQVALIVMINAAEGRVIDLAMSISEFTLMRIPESGEAIRGVIASLSMRQPADEQTVTSHK